MSVPTAEMRNGDFRGLVDSQGRQYTLYDPFTTNPTTGRASRSPIDGVAEHDRPGAHQSGGEVPVRPHGDCRRTRRSIRLVDANWIGLSRRPLDQDTRNIRVDHRFSDKDLIYVRYSYNQHYEQLRSQHAPFLPIDGFTHDRADHALVAEPLAVGTWIHTFSPTLTNEVLDQRTCATGTIAARATTRPTTRACSACRIRSAPSIGHVLDGMNSAARQLYTFGGEQPFFLVSNFLTVQDNATKIKGKHEFQFGFQFRFEDVPKSIVSAAGNFSVGHGGDVAL